MLLIKHSANSNLRKYTTYSQRHGLKRNRRLKSLILVKHILKEATAPTANRSCAVQRWNGAESSIQSVQRETDRSMRLLPQCAIRLLRSSTSLRSMSTASVQEAIRAPWHMFRLRLKTAVRCGVPGRAATSDGQVSQLSFPH